MTLEHDLDTYLGWLDDQVGTVDPNEIIEGRGPARHRPRKSRVAVLVGLLTAFVVGAVIVGVLLRDDGRVQVSTPQGSGGKPASAAACKALRKVSSDIDQAGRLSRLITTSDAQRLAQQLKQVPTATLPSDVRDALRTMATDYEQFPPNDDGTGQEVSDFLVENDTSFGAAATHLDNYVNRGCTPITADTTIGFTGEKRKIARVYQAWLGESSVDSVAKAVEDGDALRQTISDNRAKIGVSPLIKSVNLKAIDLTDATHATVNYSVLLDGRTVLADQRGKAIKTNQGWKVARATYCALLERGGASCPPR
jgi:hypothetical protein